MGDQSLSNAVRTATVAWLITALYYFYQYTLRSAPAVMVPEMSAAFGLTPVGIASLVGLFYYAYAPFSLVAGVAMDLTAKEMNSKYKETSEGGMAVSLVLC